MRHPVCAWSWGWGSQEPTLDLSRLQVQTVSAPPPPPTSPLSHTHTHTRTPAAMPARDLRRVAALGCLPVTRVTHCPTPPRAHHRLIFHPSLPPSAIHTPTRHAPSAPATHHGHAAAPASGRWALRPGAAGQAPRAFTPSGRSGPPCCRLFTGQERESISFS